MAEEAQVDTPEPVAGSDEYNQMMADKFNNPNEDADESEVEKLPVEALPEGGHEKYYNAETGAYDWQSHAKELQFNIDGRKPEQPKEDDEVKPLKIEKSEDVQSVITKAGLDAATLEAKVRETGELSAEDYQALTKVGIPEDLARSYVENINFRLQTERANALTYAGGENEWTRMAEWAVENMSADEVTSMNEVLDSANWKMGVDALRSRMGPQVVVNNEPNLIKGETVTGNQSGYRSKAEMKVDMASPKYQNDPAFRQDVARKIQTATWDLDDVG